MNAAAKAPESSADKRVSQYLAGLISDAELCDAAPEATRFEIKPAVVLLWNFRTKSYTHRWAR